MRHATKFCLLAQAGAAQSQFSCFYALSAGCLASGASGAQAGAAQTGAYDVAATKFLV